MFKRRNHRPASFARAENGLTTLEFALITPVFLLLMMGIIEFGMIMFTSSVLESATTTTARLGKTGYTAPGGTTRQQQIYANIAKLAGGFLDAKKVTISAKSYQSFDQIGQPEAFNDTNHNGIHDPTETYTDSNGNGKWDSDRGTDGVGGSGDIVVYTVSYPWTILTPVVNKVIGKTITLSARAVVKNEPYDVK